MATVQILPDVATLNKDEILRYSRHLIMPEVGMEGQQKLKAAKVLCIGTGGLGSPLALYLAGTASAQPPAVVVQPAPTVPTVVAPAPGPVVVSGTGRCGGCNGPV